MFLVTKNMAMATIPKLNHWKFKLQNVWYSNVRYSSLYLPGGVCSFASCQVYEMDLADCLVRQAVHEASFDEGDGEDGMTSTEIVKNVNR